MPVKKHKKPVSRKSASKSATGKGMSPIDRRLDRIVKQQEISDKRWEKRLEQQRVEADRRQAETDRQLRETSLEVKKLSRSIKALRQHVGGQDSQSLYRLHPCL